ncbi:hypothetical protein ABH923_001899 [Leifsonia sp. EB41]
MASSPSSTFSSTVSHGSSANDWKTSAVPGLAPLSTPPLNETVPAVGAISPAMQRSSVLLPEPERPRRATISPWWMVSVTPESTVFSPPSVANDLVTSRTSMSAVFVVIMMGAPSRAESHRLKRFSATA